MLRTLVRTCGFVTCLTVAGWSPSRAAETLAIDCRGAAAAFEQIAGLPSGLLLAIGQVESGRVDRLTGRADPWPWSTNHRGEGHYFATAQDAIAWVTAQLAAGNRSIDVGCFQVNLHYHPNAFQTLAEAFDPTANARYAASFLTRLHAQTGDWTSAIALYHSGDPLEGQRYSRRVMQAWAAEEVAGLPFVRERWPVQPVVMRLATPVVRVVVPDWATQLPFGPRYEYKSSLPRVITPGR
ncbi:MAG TPA: transglycosylase SLT domain-containing protein [Acetobacteraceae bacterium]|nr:transglycosylase SLT domain-containing protein [Acetobacteraceae bacterium]